MPSQDLLALQAVARSQLASIRDRSGRILYSSTATLRPGAVYLMGLNPGGSPTAGTTIAQSCNDLLATTACAYVDERWAGREPGRAPLQRRVQWLLRSLGCEPQDVCASNLIFVRSRDATGCGYPTLADLCWPVHEQMLDIVRPRVIVAFGTSAVSPFAYLRHRFKPTSIDRFPSGHGDWDCFAFRVADGTAIVGLPHLSRYAIDRHPAVAAWIGRYLRGE